MQIPDCEMQSLVSDSKKRRTLWSVLLWLGAEVMMWCWVVEQNIKTEEGKKIRKQLEVDFVINRGEQRYYIQSALSIINPEKREQEIASLIRIPDSFGKIVVVRDYIKPWKDKNGILYIGVEQFLLDENAIMLWS